MGFKIEVEVDEYLSKEDIRDEVEFAVGEYVRNRVDDYFKANSYGTFIENVASDVFWRCIENMGEDTRGAVRNAVRKKILGLQTYQLIGYRTDFRTGEAVPTHVQEVVDEEAEKLRPELAGILRRAMQDAVDLELAEVCSTALYDLLAKPKGVA